MKLVSIVLPVYNSETCMRSAIESCINQTYENIEIIIVDDGSTDNTAQIANEYANKDKRIIVLSQENVGSSGARNNGLKHASGEYVQFLDSDDSLEKNALEISVKEMESCPEADFLIFGFNIYHGDKLLRCPNPGNSIYRFGDSFESFAKIHYLMPSACNKLYKREYITADFKEGCVYAEDKIFNYDNFNKITTVKAIDRSLYNVQLTTSESVNKRYKKGKISDFLLSYKTEEIKLAEIFAVDFNVNDFRVKTLSSLCYIICNMVKNADFEVAKAELEAMLEDGYYKMLLSVIKSVKLYNRFLLLLIDKKRFFALKLYSSIVNFAYKLLR